MISTVEANNKTLNTKSANASSDGCKSGTPLSLYLSPPSLPLSLLLPFLSLSSFPSSLSLLLPFLSLSSFPSPLSLSCAVSWAAAGTSTTCRCAEPSQSPGARG
eukprot:TRINITY_DN35589_c0_g2_i3.p2 TRINITY_DN35589_c0_g2~~TRINITY_DN35589_c0_g2_i3.p2  ORF type:complete len:104 (+),score=33.10 TRINITY_DN35589_c0_g2_i3:37-348(+)